ncbi:hypothetical protein [Rathayibacter iranicus]|uniref:hypothetical protein n=1 Tax=Rathayibacter iranicus TaxID=59737 RepID=UPI0011B0CD70|nr:hypothetical protein [Rathayibacter iranicus]
MRGELLAHIENIHGVKEAGYLISAVDDETGGLKILWHGDGDERRQDVISAANEAHLPVAFVEYPFSWEEVDKQARKIAARRNDLSQLGFSLSGISTVAFDRPSLVVEGALMQRSLPGVSGVGASANGAISEVEDIVRSEGSIPVDVRLADPLTSISARPSRTTDVPSFSGGGFMRSFIALQSFSKVCSMAFTLRINDVERPTTARHCQPAVAGGSWRAYNSDSSSYGATDIRGDRTGTATLASRGVGWTFDGGPQSTDIVPVRGMQKVGVGSLVCTDGGNSGVHCDGKVVDVGFLITSDEEGDFYTMRAEQVDKKVLGVSGDSGGPVIVPWSDGFGAVGIMQAAGGTASCGTTNHSAVDCGWAVLFSDIYTVSADLGGTLVTG